LQEQANKKFGFSSKQTLDLAQSLYEKHKAVTYPRSGFVVFIVWVKLSNITSTNQTWLVGNRFRFFNRFINCLSIMTIIFYL
jgi:hypothetical protein